MLEFLLDWTSRASVLIALAGVIAVLARRRSAATKNLIWRVALVAVVLLPLGRIEPKISAPSPLPSASATVMSVFDKGLANPVAQKSRTSNAQDPPVSSDAEPNVDWSAIFGGIYAAGALLLLLRWSAGHLRIRRMAHHALTLPQYDGTVRRSSTSELAVPVTFGLLSPVILLPAESEDWPCERVEAALLHERAHIARRDWAWQCLVFAFNTIHWFNPLFWFMSSELERTSEAAADDEVLSAGLAPTTYAGELLRVAEAARQGFFAGAAMVGSNGVKGRLKRILADGIDRRRPGRRMLAGVVGLIALSGALVAALSVAQAARIPLRTSEQTVSEATLPDGGVARLVYLSGPDVHRAPQWRPDGSPATADDLAAAKGRSCQIGPQLDTQMSVACFEIKGVRTQGQPNATFLLNSRRDFGFGSAEFWTTNKAGPSGGQVANAVGFITIDLKPGLEVADLSIGVAAGPFDEVEHDQLGRGGLQATAIQRATGLKTVVDRSGRNPRFVQTFDPNMATVRVVIPRDLVGKNFELKAYDREGNELKTTGGIEAPQPDSSGTVHFGTDFNVKSLKQIASATLYARDYEWVKFTGVHLTPNPAPTR